MVGRASTCPSTRAPFKPFTSPTPRQPPRQRRHARLTSTSKQDRHHEFGTSTSKHSAAHSTRPKLMVPRRATAVTIAAERSLLAACTPSYASTRPGKRWYGRNYTRTRTGTPSTPSTPGASGAPSTPSIPSSTPWCAAPYQPLPTNQPGTPRTHRTPVPYSVPWNGTSTGAQCIPWTPRPSTTRGHAGQSDHFATDLPRTLYLCMQLTCHVPCTCVLRRMPLCYVFATCPLHCFATY